MDQNNSKLSHSSFEKQNSKNNKNQIRLDNNKKIERMNRKSSLQQNNQQHLSNTKESHKNSEIQPLINKLELNMKNYPFYPSIKIVKECIDQIKKVPLNENEYDNQYNKLKKQLDIYEVYII